MTKLTTIVLLLLACLAVANAQSKETYRDEKVAAELIALVRQWDAAIVKHDAATLDKLLAAEFTLSGLSKAAYLAHVKSARNDVVSAMSGEFDVRVYGDTAVLIAVDEIKSGKNGETTEWYRYIDVWVKRDGRWQCVVTESSQVKKPRAG
ncbi:MAG: nuclear transport factor 2 family protein [Pyrinomonadaceae bacterium]|nr:nuclear transport factor 2 family protein [Pyrinomonadaceae bacterium]